MPAQDHDVAQRKRQASADAEYIAWRARYYSVLDSPEWRFRASRVLEREDHICQGCRERPATQVHHTPEAYKHLGNEPLYMLIALCVQCHRAITERDRSARSA